MRDQDPVFVLLCKSLSTAKEMARQIQDYIELIEEYKRLLAVSQQVIDTQNRTIDSLERVIQERQ